MGIVADAEDGMGWRVVVGIRVMWPLLVHGLVSKTTVDVWWRRRLGRTRFDVLPQGTLESIVVEARIYCKLALLHFVAFR
jgi:hypothetical protein